MRDQFSRPIPRRLRLGAFYALSGVALVLSVVGLVFFGSVLLWLGLFALRFLPFFLHPTNDPYGISGLVWVMELVALVLSAALTVGVLYLLFVVVVSVVMLLRQLLLSIPRGTSAAATTRVVSVLRRIARSALGPVPLANRSTSGWSPLPAAAVPCLPRATRLPRPVSPAPRVIPECRRLVTGRVTLLA